MSAVAVKYYDQALISQTVSLNLPPILSVTRICAHSCHPEPCGVRTHSAKRVDAADVPFAGCHIVTHLLLNNVKHGNTNMLTCAVSVNVSTLLTSAATSAWPFAATEQWRII